MASRWMVGAVVAVVVAAGARVEAARPGGGARGASSHAARDGASVSRSHGPSGSFNRQADSIGRRADAPVAGSSVRRTATSPTSGRDFRSQINSQWQAGSHLSTAQQQNVKGLFSDLNAIKSDSQVTQQQKDDLKGDVQAVADGATRPSQESVEQLVGDVQSAWGDQALDKGEKRELTVDVGAVLQSANISATEVEAALGDAQQILEASGVTKEDLETIVNDLQAITTEAKESRP